MFRTFFFLSENQSSTYVKVLMVKGWLLLRYRGKSTLAHFDFTCSSDIVDTLNDNRYLVEGLEDYYKDRLSDV